jgi:hypothetical protein
VKAQIVELDGIVKDGGDFDMVGERIKRWKKRTVASLRTQGLSSEADEFEELEPRSFQRGNPEGNRAKRIKLYRTHLTVLAEELEGHSPHVSPTLSGPPLSPPPQVLSGPDPEERVSTELRGFATLLDETEAFFDQQRRNHSSGGPTAMLRLDRVKSTGHRLLPIVAQRAGQSVDALAGLLEEALIGDIPNAQWRRLRIVVDDAARGIHMGLPADSRVQLLKPGREHKDFFICHATEDKTVIARPIAQELTVAGRTVWFDEFELVVGDGLRRKIDEGLSISEAGVVILSPDFFLKAWPQRELDGLVAQQKRVLPIWHRVGREEVLGYSPTLADLYALKSSDGARAIAAQLIRALGRR